MRTSTRVFSFALGCAAALASGWNTPVSAAEEAGAQARLIYSRISRPEFFPILPWDPNNGSKQPFRPLKADGLETIAECNFNMAGIVFPRDLPRCERLGLGAPDKSQLGATNYTEYLERFVAEVQPQAISYDNYMVEISRDLANPDKAASYYRNLLEVRRVAQKHNLPFLNIVTGNQIRPFATPPSPANLQFQAYTTLAAGARGVTWFTYYERGYHYAAIDAQGRKTQTWAWLREVNRQVATLAPVMSRLTSTGVFFTAPAPVSNLPLLPGKVVQSVSSAAPLMVGEFRDPNGKTYVMVVNLSLEKSAPFRLSTVGPVKSINLVSAMDGARSPLDQEAGLWLTAGQGALLEIQ